MVDLRQGQREHGRQGLRPHGSEIAQVGGERLVPHTRGWMIGKEMRALGQGVNGHHQLVSGPHGQYGRIVANAQAQPRGRCDAPRRLAEIAPDQLEFGIVSGHWAGRDQRREERSAARRSAASRSSTPLT